MVKYILAILLLATLASAEVPDGYQIVFETGFDGLSVTCPDSGDGCSECADVNTRYLAGTDSDTGYTPSTQLDLSTSTNPHFIDNAPDCATDLDDCHTIEVVSSGIDQYGGGTGAALHAVMVGNCYSGSYSRVNYVFYDANPVINSPWEDLYDLYFEIDMIVVNPSVITSGNYVGIFEIVPDSFKVAVLISCTGTDCTDSPAGPKFYTKLGPNVNKDYDNAITPEAGVPFRLRIWYTASASSGTYKATYTCPSCSTPISETVINNFSATPTVDSTRPDWIKPIRAGGMWSDLEIYWTHALIAKTPATKPKSGIKVGMLDD